MATGAQALAVDPQNAAARLRTNQNRERRAREITITKTVTERTKRRAWQAYANANPTKTEEAGGAPAWGLGEDAFPANNTEAFRRAEAGLSRENQMAAELQRNRIKKDVAGTLLPLPPSLSYAEDNEEYRAAEDAYNDRAQALREQSRQVPVEQLGGIRGQLAEARQQALSQASGAINKEIENAVERATVNLGMDALSGLDIAFEDGGFTEFFTWIYDAIKAGITVLVPERPDRDIRSAGDAARAVGDKVINIVRYRFLLNSKMNITDIFDDGLIIIIVLVGLAVMVAVLGVICYIAIVYMKYAGFMQSVLSLIPSLSSAVTQLVGGAITGI